MLACYIPVFGDRTATRQYCLEKLQKEMWTATASRDEEPEPQLLLPGVLRENHYQSKNAKSLIKIELGWIHEGKYMKNCCGGGIKVLEVSKDSTRQDLASHARKLFFPNGKSKKGKWEHFQHNIFDFKESKIDERATVGELTRQDKFGMLRFYLNTSPITFPDTEMDSKIERHSETPEEQRRLVYSYEHQDNPLSAESSRTPEDSHPVDLDVVEPSSQSYYSEAVEGLPVYEPINWNMDDTVPVLFPVDEVFSVPSTSTSNLNGHVQETGQIRFVEYQQLHVRIKLHRANLVDEMIGQFKNEAIFSYHLKYSFFNERGADANGLARDVYAAFWSDFLDCAAEGAEMKVPTLSPRWQEEEWKAVGRILAKGFMDQGYFPLRFAPAFTTALIFGEHAVSAELLFESLLLYLSQCQRDLIMAALMDMDSDNQDDLLDLLDQMGVKEVPAKDTLKAVLLQLAHIKMIQQPKYALDNMSAAAGQALRTILPTMLKIRDMYNDKKPTCSKVLKMIKAFPLTSAERQALGFLHQYVQELDEVGLRKLLRFVTGSDIICVSRVHITFTTLEGLARRPVAHTCGSVLELPCTYKSYPELREEMENVLTSNYLNMDFL